MNPAVAACLKAKNKGGAMRRTIVLAAALLAILSPVLHAQDRSLSSPAGFVRVTVEPGESKAVSLPWCPWDDSVNAVLKYALRGASSNEATADRVLKFVPLLPGYEQAFRVEDRWVENWNSGKDSDLTIEPGDGFILINKSPTEPKCAFLAGEVVMDGELSLSLDPGMNLAAYPYTGGGSMMAYTGGAGGSGIVIVRYVTGGGSVEPSLPGPVFMIK
jgi:hypothetical protein